MKLLSPCCNVEVWIFQAYKEAVPIICCSGCDNEWDEDGELI